MKFKVQVQTAGSGESWSGNSLKFETREEGEKYAEDLMMRWTAVTDWRVIESEEK